MNYDGDVVYEINNRDEIIFVNEGWVQFALANQGTHLIPEKIIHRPLWDFITDSSTCQIYKDIVGRVRAGRQTRFDFRCDSPTFRRFMEMTITAQESVAVK